MVRQQDWLGPLQVGVTRQDGATVGCRHFDQRDLQVVQALKRGADRFLRPKAQVGDHLIVTRTRGVQPARRSAGDLGEPCLDVHVDIFELRVEL